MISPLQSAGTTGGRNGCRKNIAMTNGDLISDLTHFKIEQGMSDKTIKKKKRLEIQRDKT